MLTQKELSTRQGGDSDVAPDPMPPTKIRAFKEEFPWIKKHVGGAIVQAYAFGIEPTLLNYSPGEIGDWLFGPIPLLTEPVYYLERILLLDEKGEEVTAEEVKRRKRFLLFGPTVTRAKRISGTVFRGTTVGCAVERLGEKADSIRFLLSYFAYTLAVIIYRLPKNVSLRQWIETEVESEKASLRA